MNGTYRRSYANNYNTEASVKLEITSFTYIKSVLAEVHNRKEHLSYKIIPIQSVLPFL
jgi:hypothetical protein